MLRPLYHIISAILHRRPDNHHALLKATWCLGPRGGVLFEMYIAFLHNGLAPSPFPISVAHLSWVALSWLHLYSIFTTFIDMNNRTARLLNLHVPRSLTLCINGVYIIENAGVYPHTRWPDNRRLRSHVTDSLIPKVYTQTWLKNCCHIISSEFDCTALISYRTLLSTAFSGGVSP